MPIPKISKAQLDKLYELARAMPNMEPQRASVHTSVGVVMHMLGKDWLEKHILPGAKQKNVLTLTNVIDADESARQLRIVDLAEMLYNLQGVGGFGDCVRRLVDGDIEGTLTELDMARLLYLHSITFRFVVPAMRKGLDYDFEITFPNGVVACADAKCKIEGNAFNAKSLDNSLEKARSQLPKDQPGIIFVKHPAKWAVENLTEIQDVTKSFFRTSQRIVSVKYYVQPFERRGDVIVHRHGYLELTNQKHRFSKDQDWSLFPIGQLRDLEVPAHWQRILHFDGNPRSAPGPFLG